MELSSPENLPSDRIKAVNELVKGRELANQLKLILINNPTGNDDGSSLASEDLVKKILNSFTNTLSILNRFDSDYDVSQFPASSHCSDGRKSEDFGESSKSTSAVKDRRGRYKRRKSSHSWIKDSSNLIDDGYAWRKYGQKSILNAKYPRNYFRCTHKFDQGCQATKQVQRIEDELYRTTYSGHHTCKNFLNASQLVMDSTDEPTTLLSFYKDNVDDDHNNSNNHLPIKPDNPLLVTSSQSVKQEENQQVHHQYSSSSSDYFVSPDLSTFDHADVISGMNSTSCTTTSAHSLDMDMDMDMDMMVGYIGFDDEALPLDFFAE